MSRKQWIRCEWDERKGIRIQPRESGWYAAVPDTCESCVVKVFLFPNIWDVFVKNEEFMRDITDFNYFYRLENEYEKLPKPPW